MPFGRLDRILSAPSGSKFSLAWYRQNVGFQGSPKTWPQGTTQKQLDSDNLGQIVFRLLGGLNSSKIFLFGLAWPKARRIAKPDAAFIVARRV